MKRTLERLFMIKWILANAANWVVFGILTVGYTATSQSSAGLAMIRVVTLGWIFGGAFGGIMQWLIIRRKIGRAGLWVPASLFGWLLGGAGLVITTGVVSGIGILGMIIAWGMGGVIVGIAQWLVLRRQVRKSFMWVMASASGWILGGFVSKIIAGLTNWFARWAIGDTIDVIFRGLAWILGNAVGGIAEGIVIGVMTGITFVWLLTKYPIDELVHPSAKTMAVKIPQSTFLNTLLTVSLLLLSLMLSMGVLFGGIWRHLSTSSPNSLLYLLASNVFIGIPLLILGGFLLLPQKQIVSFVSKTWLQRFSFKRSKYDFLFLRIIGVMLVCFGCIFIYGLSINRHSNSILFVTQSTLNPSIVNATPTYSIHLEPTWTMTP